MGKKKNRSIKEVSPTLITCSKCGTEKPVNWFKKKKPPLCPCCLYAETPHKIYLSKQAPKRKREKRTLIIRSPRIAPYATHIERHARLIREATGAELRLKAALEDLQGDGAHFHFTFQKPIGPFFADFAFESSSLVVEVDGGYHSTAEQMERDAKRTSYLAERGWRVIRFTNGKVARKLDEVLKEIERMVGSSATLKTPAGFVIVPPKLLTP